MTSRDNRHGLVEDRLQQHMLYARSFRSAMIACIAMAGALVAAIAVCAWLVVWKPEPRYFAVQPDGSLIEMVPLDRPFQSDAAVVNFAVQGVTRAHTVSFSSWRGDFAEARKWFTTDGFESYIQALQDSGNLELIRTQRLNTYAIANRAVIVAQRLGADGIWRWQVEIPLTITYESARERSQQEVLGTVIVRRVPTIEHIQGIGIERFRGQVTRG